MNTRSNMNNMIKLDERCYYVDWLRILAMAVVFLFHCARFFDDGGWHVKNSVTDIGFTILTGFTSQWTMPFFFLLAGAGTWFALGRRSPGQYVGARFKRLLLPYLFGIVLWLPPQKYLEALFYNRFDGSFLEFLPRYFSADTLWIDGTFRFLGHYGYHLWFLGFLFIFSLLLLPLFAYLKRESSGHILAALRRPLYAKAGLFLPVIPTALVQFGLRPLSPDYLQWADFCYWLIFFFCGFLLFSDPGLQEKIESRLKTHGIIALIAVSLLLAWFLSGDLRPLEEHPGFSLGDLALQSLRSLNTWAWILFFLGLGRRYLQRTDRVMAYANRAVLPFYILHQTVILIIGFFIIQWPVGMIGKFLLIAAASFAVIMALYEVLRRSKVLRFIFGMKG
jgi:surface polysaccharide O-acyltransferase-like enzyme